VNRAPAPAPTRAEWWSIAGGLVLAAALMWPLRGYVTDDTFIHLQYARHLAEGLGPVFNLGERVYGSTSPLWVALIADGIALGFDGLRTARVLGAIATLGSVGLQLMPHQHPELRALATVGGNAWMLRRSPGMETPPVVALTPPASWRHRGRSVGLRSRRTGALWSLAALTRPEAVSLLAIWGPVLTQTRQPRRPAPLSGRCRR
jgi:hypothetical protein